jgi:signal transduction histidine kinase
MRSEPTHVEAADYLRRVEILAALSDADLVRLLERAHEVEVRAGTLLIREGDAGDEMYVVLDGQLDVSMREGNVDEVVAQRGRGDVVGEMALLGSGRRTASVRAVSDTRVLAIGREAFTTLLSFSPDAATSIYKTSIEREHAMASTLARREKLAALGTMAAGLAHELNNPAAALKRSSAELGTVLRERDRSAIALFGRGLQAKEMERSLKLGDIAAEVFEEATSAASAGRTSRDAESALTAYLERLAVEDAWDRAPALADAGWTAARLQEVLESFEPANREAAIAWLAADASCRVLQREIAACSEAISSLVGAVKDYAHLDRAAIATVDVHGSLENTLVILKHRLGSGGVVVERDYAPELPRIEGYPGELTQVWTNLIDNAIAALGGAGVLVLRTAHGHSQVTVEVADDGPGIPDDVAPHIFEPFLTTKGVGEGTGLGLYITKEIVEQRHGGSLSFTSRPGATTFRVTLPLRLART